MLERVAQILDALDGGPAGASDIGRLTGLSVSTVHRIALAMVEEGFLRRYADGRYVHGWRVARSRLDTTALPHVLALRDACGESVQLWVRSGDFRVCRLSAETEHALRVTLPVGARIPLPAGSAGGVLAKTPEAQESILQHGWFEQIQSRTQGLSSVSAPIVIDGALVAALCVVVPVARLHTTPGRDHGELLVEAARRLSEELHG
ncbi:helix-turn-helix domain-containing protein (plasmid) [Rathayibacter sp. VKM Ac-2760]|nr:helix-turn-helix domain-containing protein [Rathayibacter sp. VKM Ac-2760]